MEDFSKNLIAVEELFIAVEISGTDNFVAKAVTASMR
jgi:hypothetical protein